MTADPPLPTTPPDPPPGACVTQHATRFGISTKLQVAFGVVAGLTVIAAAVALLSFNTMEQGLRQVTGRQVPVTIDALRLSVISREISATAARFISARTVTDQRSAMAAIEDKRVDLATVLGRLRTMNGESAALVDVRRAVAAAGRQPCGLGRGDHATHCAAGGDREAAGSDAPHPRRDYRPPRRNVQPQPSAGDRNADPSTRQSDQRRLHREGA